MVSCQWCYSVVNGVYWNYEEEVNYLESVQHRFNKRLM